MEKYIEFEEMKAQLAVLNRKLEQETILNERLLRRAMKEKAWNIRRKMIIESMVCAIMVPYFIWIIPLIAPGISIGFCYFTCFFLLLALGCNYYLYHHFRPEEFIYGNLLEARKDTLKLKKIYANWLKFIGLPFIIVFLSWFVHEITRLQEGERLEDMLTAVIIGTIAGGIIGTYRYLKIQHTADAILQQIEEMNEK